MSAPEDQGALLDAVVPLSPASVVGLLAGAASAAPGERPEVSIHLGGGQILGGVLVRVDTDRGNEVVVLADRQSGRLGYVLLASVTAVELHNAGAFQDVITGGRLPLRGTGVPVTRLALQREFAPTAEFPLRVGWDELPESDSVLANLDRLLRGLRDAAGQIRVDEMGRQAWAGVAALQVEHAHGTELSVHRIPEGLCVRADLLAALPRTLAAELYRDINALL